MVVEAMSVTREELYEQVWQQPMTTVAARYKVSSSFPPIAQIVPYAAQPLEMRKAKRRLRDLKLAPKPSKRTDSLAVLLDDRRRR